VLPLRVILYATDFSDHSRYAFQAACALARECHARLVVLHVVEPPATVVAGTSAVPLFAEEMPLAAADEDLHRVLPPDPELGVEHRLEVGHPAETILRVARELSADLIVMGTHGRHGLGRLLVGSVAEQVLRQARCPVLTMKRPTPDEGPWVDAAALETAGV
jgi:nucleotide-binding universal stress UspA family protein